MTDGWRCGAGAAAVDGGDTLKINTTHEKARASRRLSFFWGSVFLGGRMCSCGRDCTHLFQSGHRVPAVGHPGGEVGGGRRFIIFIGLRHKL